jgi:ribosome biogenesis protein ERB1
MCPRLFRKKVNVSDPSKLIPELPSPNDLKPFPSQVSIDFNFHTTCVRTIAVSPNGAFLASGDEDSNCVIWCVRTSKIVRKYKLSNKVIDKLQWCPNPSFCILAVANEEKVHLIAPGLSTREVNSDTISLLNAAGKINQLESAATDKKESLCSWEFNNLETRG